MQAFKLYSNWPMYWLNSITCICKDANGWSETYKSNIWIAWHGDKYSIPTVSLATNRILYIRAYMNNKYIWETGNYTWSNNLCLSLGTFFDVPFRDGISAEDLGLVMIDFSCDSTLYFITGRKCKAVQMLQLMLFVDVHQLFSVYAFFGSYTVI